VVGCVCVCVCVRERERERERNILESRQKKKLGFGSFQAANCFISNQINDTMSSKQHLPYNVNDKHMGLY